MPKMSPLAIERKVAYLRVLKNQNIRFDYKKWFRVTIELEIVLLTVFKYQKISSDHENSFEQFIEDFYTSILSKMPILCYVIVSLRYFVIRKSVNSQKTCQD